jgi:hypothetical protein
MKPQELPIPPQVAKARQAGELVRAWIADNSLICSLDIGRFGDDEVTMWGILTADVVRHVADAIHQQNGIPLEQAIEQIRKVLNAELTSPTADAKGSFN